MLVRDYQTARHQVTDSSMPVSERFYLGDAVFVAAVEGPDELVEELARALERPVFLPYLGRRSCPPARPLSLGVRHEASLEQALREEPWRAARWYQRRQRTATVELAVLVDTAAGDGTADLQRDLPLSFDPLHRRYALRGVRTEQLELTNPASRVPDHDPIAALGGV